MLVRTSISGICLVPQILICLMLSMYVRVLRCAMPVFVLFRTIAKSGGVFEAAHGSPNKDGA